MDKNIMLYIYRYEMNLDKETATKSICLSSLFSEFRIPNPK